MHKPVIHLAQGVSELAMVGNLPSLLSSAADCVFDAGAVEAVQTEVIQDHYPCRYILLHNAKVVVDQHRVLYTDAEDRLYADAYAKAWQYEAGLDASARQPKALETVQTVPGTWIAGSLSPLSGNLYHAILDNFVQARHAEIAPGSLGVVFASDGVARPELEGLFRAFVGDSPSRTLAPGRYSVERLIIPPPSSKGDLYSVDAIRFAARVLSSLVNTRKPHHHLRLFVSRSDAASRHLINEETLRHRLREIGFTVICPGDFAIQTQLELFAAAEAIVGVHGMGLTPMLASRQCRALFEFEAYGWTSTPYRSFAAAMGMRYANLPVRMIEPDRGGQFDWLAEADVDAAVEVVRSWLS